MTGPASSTFRPPQADGPRVDARYLRAFVDETSTTTYARDYGYWRISVGVTFGGPTY